MKKFNIGYHVKTLLRGIVRVAFGALTTGLVYVAVVGFLYVQNEDGYKAVCDFIVSAALMFGALISMYVQGFGFPFKGGKHSK